MHHPFSPLVVFKFCPACGSQSIAPDSVKSLKCAACGFRYYINMNAAVVAVIRNQKNEVLFTTRKHDPSKGMLDLPGGFIDMGENAEHAVKREIREELNLEISKLEYVGTFTNKYLYAGIEYQTLDIVYLCTVDSFTDLKVDDDVTGYEFIDPARVRQQDISFDSVRQIAAYIAANF
jgi:NAD+ diphosphatase